jgi:hypothetical protein
MEEVGLGMQGGGDKRSKQREQDEKLDTVFSTKGVTSSPQ